MIYEYRCKACESVVDVVKPVSRIDEKELCPLCWQPMERRVVNKPQVMWPTFQAGYNPAFGKVFENQAQVKDEIRRMNGERGVRLEEVGNDSLDHVKPKRQEYTLD